MSGMLEIPLKDLKKWLEQETVSIIEPLKTEAENLLNNIREKLEDIQETCEKILDDSEKEMLKSSPKTYRRSREAYKFARKVSETIEKANFPSRISYESLKTLYDDLEKTLVEIEQERGSSYPRISPYFIIDRRRLDATLKRAADSLKEIRSFTSEEYIKAKALENAFSITDELLHSLNELKEVKEQEKKMELGRKNLEKEIEENQQKITLIQERGEMQELVQLDEKMKELEEKVKRNMSPLQKPFLKFQSLVRSSDYPLPLDEAKKLDEYLGNPFKALANEEEGYPMLKRILSKMNDAITRGKMKLKTSRLRKAQKQMNDIVQKDALAQLHQSCREVLSQTQRLSTSEAIASSQNELTQLQKNLGELEKQKELADSRVALLESEHKRILEKTENQKKELRKIVFELTGKDIQVT